MWTSEGKFGLLRLWMVVKLWACVRSPRWAYRGRALQKKLKRNNQVGREKPRPKSIRKEGGRKCQASDQNSSVAGTARRAGLESALWIGRRVTGTTGASF